VARRGEPRCPIPEELTVQKPIWASTRAACERDFRTAARLLAVRATQDEAMPREAPRQTDEVCGESGGTKVNSSATSFTQSRILAGNGDVRKVGRQAWIQPIH
jgi:hypothetical protein